MGTTYQSTTLAAPVADVWAAIRDFHDLSWAEGVIESCEAGGSLKGDQIGAKRLLNGVFHETLLDLNDLEHVIKYQIDDGPSPVSKEEVSNYVGVVHLLPITDSGKTFIEWSSSWHGKDQECHDFCQQIYLALLGALAKRFS